MEIESKYQVFEDYEKKLKQAGYVFKKDSRQVDFYYLSRKVINGKEIYLRLREDVKHGTYELGFHEVVSNLSTKETELQIDSKEDFEKMKYIMEGLGMNLLCVVDKKRRVFTKNRITAVMDEVKDLGFFVEIEVESESENKEMKAILESEAKLLELDEKNRVLGCGYPDLVIRKKN